MLRQPTIHIQPARVFHAAFIGTLTFAVTLLSYFPLTVGIVQGVLQAQ